MESDIISILFNPVYNGFSVITDYKTTRNQYKWNVLVIPQNIIMKLVIPLTFKPFFPFFHRGQRFTIGGLRNNLELTDL